MHESGEVYAAANCYAWTLEKSSERSFLNGPQVVKDYSIWYDYSDLEMR